MNASKTASVALALTAALGGSAAVQAAANPFGISELGGGYLQLAEAATGATNSGAKKTAAEGKCGEGKCGANKKTAEGKCGGERRRR